MMDKAAVRASIGARLKQITDAERRQWSQEIAHNLFLMDRVNDAHRVFCFFAMETEPDSLPIIERFLRAGAHVYLPSVIAPGRMKAVRVTDLTVLKRGAYGIFAPESGIVGKPEAFDLMLVPGVAFDGAVVRLGHGGGFYDRYLQKTAGYKVGVAFELQRVEALPAQNHDAHMDCLVTQRGVYTRKGE